VTTGFGSNLPTKCKQHAATREPTRDGQEVGVPRGGGKAHQIQRHSWSMAVAWRLATAWSSSIAAKEARESESPH
jgi:hypothetical protein